MSMWPFLARGGWFLRRSTPGWVITGITTADLLWACAAAFLALVDGLTSTFGLALAGFLSVILAMGLSLTPGVGRREGRGPPLGRSYGKREGSDQIRTGYHPHPPRAARRGDAGSWGCRPGRQSLGP